MNEWMNLPFLMDSHWNCEPRWWWRKWKWSSWSWLLLDWLILNPGQLGSFLNLFPRHQFQIGLEKLINLHARNWGLSSLLLTVDVTKVEMKNQILYLGRISKRWNWREKTKNIFIFLFERLNKLWKSNNQIIYSKNVKKESK